MKKIWFLLMVATLTAGIMISGCTSQTGVSPTPSAAPTGLASPSATTPIEQLPEMALKLSDFPSGFELIYEGETLPPDESSLLSDPYYQGGYSITVSNESPELSAGEMVDQMILVYSRPATRERLEEVFFAHYPELSNWSLTSLPDPGIGDASIAYHFVYPETTLTGYTIIFGKGDVYEIIMTMRGDDTAEYALIEDIARKAAGKIR